MAQHMLMNLVGVVAELFDRFLGYRHAEKLRGAKQYGRFPKVWTKS